LISDEHGIKRVAYGPGKDGVEFLFWTIDGMGHHWPGSKTEGLPDSIIGPGTDKMEATDAIWKFLSRHTLSVRAEAP
jgi:polyhydroxybutyrate depolymerase